MRLAFIPLLILCSAAFADIHCSRDCLPPDTKWFTVERVEIFDSIPFDSAYYIDETWGYTKIPRVSFVEQFGAGLAGAGGILVTVLSQLLVAVFKRKVRGE